MVVDITRISAIETRENYWLGRNFHKVTHFHTFDKQILAISAIGKDQNIKVCKPSLEDFPYQESFSLSE